jgi:hypothetical protein
MFSEADHAPLNALRRAALRGPHNGKPGVDPALGREGPPMTNDARADRAQAAISAYREFTGDVPDEGHFRDLLCDLMHLAKRDGAGDHYTWNGSRYGKDRDLSFDEALRMARASFEAED